MSDGGDIRPVPDPTILTTLQLVRELSSLKELLMARIESLERATLIRQTRLDQVPADTALLIQQLKLILDQRFQTIEGQFRERDVRTTLSSSAADDALKAALQAAKELVGAQGEAQAAAAVKSETSFTKQIDQIGTIIQTLEKALNDRLTELKERIDRNEGNDQGSDRYANNAKNNTQVAIAAAALVITLVIFFVTLYLTAKK